MDKQYKLPNITQEAIDKLGVRLAEKGPEYEPVLSKLKNRYDGPLVKFVEKHASSVVDRMESNHAAMMCEIVEPLAQKLESGDLSALSDMLQYENFAKNRQRIGITDIKTQITRGCLITPWMIKLQGQGKEYQTGSDYGHKLWILLPSEKTIGELETKLNKPSFVGESLTHFQNSGQIVTWIGYFSQTALHNVTYGRPVSANNVRVAIEFGALSTAHLIEYQARIDAQKT